MEVVNFRIEESKVNKGQFVLIAKTVDEKEFVVAGDHYTPTYLIPINQSWDLKDLKTE